MTAKKTAPEKAAPRKRTSRKPKSIAPTPEPGEGIREFMERTGGTPRDEVVEEDHE